MITLKNRHAFEKMSIAGKLLASLFSKLMSIIQPGISTLAIDSFIEQYLDEHNLLSCTKGFMSYKHASCISINDEVVHGIPHNKVFLHEGDLVKIDICASWSGYCADMARCFIVGQASAQVEQFVQVAYSALNKGIEQAYPGKHIGDISAAIQAEIEKHGYGVVRDFAGHGIGKKMHEDPEILNYGKAGTGSLIKPGMAFAIEPMLTLGNYHVYVASDGWTAKTVDKSLAAHVEDTVIIREHGPEVITRL